MAERLWFVLYIVIVVALGVVHEEWVMAAAIAAAVLANGRAGARVLRRAVLVLLVFNTAVTAGYLLYSYMTYADPYAMLLFNLRALAITMLTFTLIRYVDLHKIFGFSQKAAVYYSFAMSQALQLKRVLYDYYDAVASRGAGLKKGLSEGRLSKVLERLFETMLHSSEEQNMGMRSRGLLND